jgi:polysaccharide biosynthesis/export protein
MTITNLTLDLRLIAIHLFVVLAFGVLTGQSVEAQASAPNQRADAPVSSTGPTDVRLPATVSEDYLINAEDVLEVYVFDVPELSRDYIVSAAGTVIVPLLAKPVQAAGLSPGEFAHALEENFRESGRLSRPQITVAIKQSRRSVVTVEGAVRSPQALPVMARTKLLSILSECGGLADDHGSIVTVSRGTLAMQALAFEGGPVTPTVTVELKKLMDANDPMSQFAVWPGDRVSVERAGIFYVLGQVGRPGGYNLKSAQEQVTVLQALAIAGDVTIVAKKSKAVIIRKDSTAPGGRIEVALDLAHIVAGRSPDRVLQNNDILYIPASGGKRALQTFLGVPASVATAAAYSRF